MDRPHQTMTSDELGALWKELQNLEAHLNARQLVGTLTSFKALRRLQGVLLKEHTVIENMETTYPDYKATRP